MKIVIALVLALMLGACATTVPSSTRGECQVFTDPGFAVQGKRLIDKRWIGATQEKGIEVCHWKRPVR